MKFGCNKTLMMLKCLSVVKERLQDNFIQNWNAEINESSRAVLTDKLQVFS